VSVESEADEVWSTLELSNDETPVLVDCSELDVTAVALAVSVGDRSDVGACPVVTLELSPVELELSPSAPMY
jgi:hypothetical protein